jgi:hypothetical protein
MLDRNKWLYGDYGHIYCRYTEKIYSINMNDIKCTKFLVLASIEMDEGYRNKGIMTKLLTDLIKNIQLPIYIENVMSDSLIHLLTTKFNAILCKYSQYDSNYLIL